MPLGVLRFAVLGAVRAWRDDVELDLGPPQQRAMLALLLAYAGQPVSVSEIVDVLWGTDPPASAVNIVHRQVGQLRRLFEPGLPTRAPGRWLARAGSGYRLDAGPDSLDLLRFRDLVARARASRDVALYATALELWRGPAAAGVEPDVRTHPAFAALDREHLTAVRDAADLSLEAGRAEQVLPAVQRAAASHPLDEPLHARLIRVLAVTGRQADALAAYRRVRTQLADELGIDPGPELRAANDHVLSPRVDTDPGPTPAVRPAQLPGDLSTFTGRRTEIADVLALHTSDRPPSTVVISAIGGMAGIGKTTLAVHWAHQVADRYPDGQLYVNLRGFDPTGTVMSAAEAVRGFLDAFGVSPHRVPASLDAQAALYRSLLAGKRVLVVLDNARDSDQVRPLLPGSPGCLAIVTSRNQLTGLVATDGAHPLTLEPLSTADARDFLARRLGATRVAKEPKAVNDIVAACAGLPLALAIVAARAATSPRFPLAALAADLNASRSRLDAFTGTDPTIDVRTVFSWSYHTLSSDAARLFRLLALHPSADVGGAAAASLAGIPAAAAQPLLAELTRAHLVDQPAPGRYVLHDLLRAYATELGSDVDTREERDAATRRLLDHYLHTTRAADRLLSPHRQASTPDDPADGVTVPPIGDRDESLAWFTREHATLLGVIEHAAVNRYEGHTIGLAEAVSEFLNRRGHWHDWTASHRTALEAAVRLGDRGAQARIHRAIGSAYDQLGRHHDAHTEITLALDLYTELRDLNGQAAAHRSLAELLGPTAAALDHAQQALALYRAAGDHGGEGAALNAVGWHHTLLGNHHEAIEHCGKALTILERVGNQRGEAATWDSLGHAHHHLGDHTQAIICYQHAAQLRHTAGDRYPEAKTLTRLGQVHAAIGDGAAARAAWRKALTILADLDHPDADEVNARLAALTPP